MLEDLAVERLEQFKLPEIVELEPRGAYYGLVGMVEPGGAFSFSQMLRSVFRDRRGYYLWAGAAITDGSTADSEYEETRLKLSSIRVLPAGPAPDHSALADT